MKKKIYWIDDSVQKLEHIMQGIIKQLWNVNDENNDNKIISKFLVFGNEYLGESGETNHSLQKENKLQCKLDLYFRIACSQRESVSWKRDVYKKNHFLIEDCVKMLFKEWSEYEANLLTDEENDSECQERQKDLNLLKEIEKYWIPKNRDAMDESKWKQDAVGKVEKLIELMNIEQGSCVGIDLALLKKDRDSIQYNDKPVIAMELYHQLKKNYYCFLYSTYSYENYLVPRCRQIYSDYYKDDCVIYRREEMMIKGNYEEIAHKIRQGWEKWLEERNNNGEHLEERNNNGEHMG